MTYRQKQKDLQYNQ